MKIVFGSMKSNIKVTTTNNIVPNYGMANVKLGGGVGSIYVHQSFEVPFSIILMDLTFHNTFHNPFIEIQCTDKYWLTLTLLHIS